RRFADHRVELLVRRHNLSSHEHTTLSSESLTSCYTCAPIADHQLSGGVAERLIAPVLKTGRPNGLVSSNLTPSAISIFDCRLPISDWQQYEVRHDKGAQGSKNRCANDVGQVMRADVHPREPDQNRDCEAHKADPPTRDKQNAKERGRSANVSGWKRVIFRGETWTAPTYVGVH